MQNTAPAAHPIHNATKAQTHLPCRSAGSQLSQPAT